MAGCLFPSLSISYWFKCDSCNLHGFYNLGFLKSIFFLFRSVFTQLPGLTEELMMKLSYIPVPWFNWSLPRLVVSFRNSLTFCHWFTFSIMNTLILIVQVTWQTVIIWVILVGWIILRRNLLVRYINTPYLGSGWVCFMILDCLTVRWFLHYVRLPNLTTNSRSFSYLWTKTTGWGRTF